MTTLEFVAIANLAINFCNSTEHTKVYVTDCMEKVKVCLKVAKNKDDCVSPHGILYNYFYDKRWLNYPCEIDIRLNIIEGREINPKQEENYKYCITNRFNKFESTYKKYKWLWN